jgi:hypothetical protein
MMKIRALEPPQPGPQKSKLDPQSKATRLLKAVLAKSFLEILIVCVVIALAAYSNFNPILRGAIDAADASRVAGWVYDPLSREEAVEVQLFIDGVFVATQTANQRREDLVRAEAAPDASHGFSFNLRNLKLAPGSHTTQVFAVRDANGPNKMLTSLSKAPRVIKVPDHP